MCICSSSSSSSAHYAGRCLALSVPGHDDYMNKNVTESIRLYQLQPKKIVPSWKSCSTVTHLFKISRNQQQEINAALTQHKLKDARCLGAPMTAAVAEQASSCLRPPWRTAKFADLWGVWRRPFCWHCCLFSASPRDKRDVVPKNKTGRAKILE